MREFNTVAQTGNFLLDGLLWGTAWSDRTITYYISDAPLFDETSEAVIPWTSYEVSRIEAALKSWADVSNLNFVRVEDRAQATLSLKLGIPEDIDDEDGAHAPHHHGADSLLGFAFPPGERADGIDVAGAVYLNHLYPGWDRDGSLGTLEQGGYSYITIIHEIGHALGMAHPHDDGGTSSVYPGVTGDDDVGNAPGFNRDLFTIMSYVNGLLFDRLWTETEAYGFPGTPMAFDIAVIQHIYGANTTHATGDDVYVIPDNDGVGIGFEAIWDAGGNDSIRYDGARDVIIDLRAATLDADDGLLAGGGLSIASGVTGGFTIAHGVVIENAIAGSGNDWIVGNGSDNTVSAGAGNDMIVASSGRDMIDGGAGFDVLVVELEKQSLALSVEGGSVVVAGADMESHLTNIQFVQFSNGSAVIAASFAEAVTARLYSALFDRDADMGGYKHWALSLDQGVTVHQIAGLFLSSDEAAPLRTAANDADFISLLYRNALEREASVVDVSWWTDAMAEGSVGRSDATVHFAAASEASQVHADRVIELFTIA
jgi:hypothetical protein